MAERYIELVPGDRLTVYAVPAPDLTPPPEPPDQTSEDLMVLTEIGGVPIYAFPDGTYVHYLSDLDVCVDGSGEDHGDPYFQAQTAYYNNGKYLNADEDKYVVVPPQIRSMVGPIVMGCQARVTNMKTGVVSDGVVGDIGPKTKTGECAICLAQILNPKVSANVGDSERSYLYEIWPGIPAVVDGKRYALEPA
jgi:hypothetical protein